MRPHPVLLVLLATFVTSVAAPAQRALGRNFRFDFALGGGGAIHETESSPFDGDTRGGFTRLRFEGVGRRGFGGGVRLESWGSDDDLFVDEGFIAQESRARAIFGHFTYRVGRGRFLMPIRLGVMAHNYELEQVPSPSTTTLDVDTVGPRFEVAPEVIFNRGAPVEVSAYGEFGLAGGYSTVETSTSSFSFDSGSAFWFFEFGSRVRWQFLELGLGFVHHGMAMDESDRIGTTVVNGFAAGFTGIVFTGAFVF